MPLDSVTVSALGRELRKKLVGAKIDRVQQPGRDTILLSVRCGGENLRLCVCGGVGSARIHFTRAAFENPMQPPMFCMLLRKHLTGARISDVRQIQRERLILLELETYDEMGVAVRKRLAVEMMGRVSNILLLGPEGHIIDCLRRVDTDMNATRPALPGLLYRLPEPQDKPDFFSLSSEERRGLLTEYRKTSAGAPAAAEMSLDQWLRKTFSSLSPLICRELSFRCGGDPDNLPPAMDALADSVLAEDFQPYMLLSGGKPKDFSFMSIRQYGESMQGEVFEDFSTLLDAFYTRRSQAEDMKKHTRDLRQTVKSALNRTEKKLRLQEQDLEAASKRDEKRRWADLIIANMYRAEKGADRLVAQDFYEDGCPETVIPMDPLKSPQANAEQYYKEYTKAKNAEIHLTELIEKNRRDIRYLSSVLDEIDRCASESDIADIRQELTDTGFLKKSGRARDKRGGKNSNAKNTKKKTRTLPSQPLRYVSDSGWEILVGRSNRQNDQLTLRTSDRGDIWLHVQKIHGSHVLIRCAGAEVDSETLSQAASLAALHSQASGGGKVPVDYTRAKYVKKPSGALPGMVIYSNYATIAAEADEALAQRLKSKQPSRGN